MVDLSSDAVWPRTVFLCLALPVGTGFGCHDEHHAIRMKTQATRKHSSRDKSSGSGSNTPLLEKKKSFGLCLKAPVYAQSHLVLCMYGTFRVLISTVVLIFNQTRECQVKQTQSEHTPRTHRTGTIFWANHGIHLLI